MEKIKKERNEAERKATSVATEFAESARSWETSKSMLVREREEGGERMKDMSVQNNLLHAQLENVTTKVQQLEEARGKTRTRVLEICEGNDDPDDDAATSSDSSSSTTTSTLSSSSSSSSSSSLAVSTSESQLRLLIQHLRKDKNVVEAQLELKKSSCFRLEHDVTQLRKKLDEQKREEKETEEDKQKAVEEREEHAKLLEDVRMMNTYRESNEFLQTDNKSLTMKNKELSQELENLKEASKPLEIERRRLLSDVESGRAQAEGLREENKMWQVRYYLKRILILCVCVIFFFFFPFCRLELFFFFFFLSFFSFSFIVC